MYNHLNVCKQMNSGPFKMLSTNYALKIIYNMYKEDLALNDLQWLTSHKIN